MLCATFHGRLLIVLTEVLLFTVFATFAVESQRHFSLTEEEYWRTVQKTHSKLLSYVKAERYLAEGRIKCAVKVV